MKAVLITIVKRTIIYIAVALVAGDRAGINLVQDLTLSSRCLDVNLTELEI